jgi:hypothetical protein
VLSFKMRISPSAAKKTNSKIQLFTCLIPSYILDSEYIFSHTFPCFVVRIRFMKTMAGVSPFFNRAAI